MVKESKQEAQEQPVECPEKEEIKFTFKDDKLPSNCNTSTLNELLKEIIHIEETVLGWDDLKLFAGVSGDTPINLKSYVEFNDSLLGEHHCRAIHRRLTRTLNKLKELGGESIKEQGCPKKEETSLKPWEQEELEHTNRITNDFKQLFKSSPIAFTAVESAMNVIVLADETHKKYGLGHLQITIDGEEMNVDKYLDSREPDKGWLPAKYTFLSRKILAESKLFKDLVDKIISDFEAEIKANSDWCK